MLNGTQVPTNCQIIYYTPGAQTVTFNANGGSCETSTKTFPLSGKYSNLPTATWAGYTFEGWYTATDGGSKITEGKTVSTNWFLTLYAHWIANTHSVTLDRQGGTGGTTAVSATTGTAMPAIAVPTRTGYSFGGYYTAANGQGTKYYTAEGKSARAWGEGTASTLYAKWTANSYTVTFDRQGGEGGAGSATATYGSPMPTIVAPTRTDYLFGGYYSAKNGEGTQYYAATGESMGAWDKAFATTLYAKWTSTTLSIMPPTRNFGTRGGAYAIVTSGSGTWNAETSESWITLNATGGQAGYPVAYAVGATTQAESRTGHVFVSGHVHTVTQDGQGATIAPASATFEREGGEGTISVTVKDGVEWKAISNCDWAGVSPASGTGPGLVAFTVSLLDEFMVRQGTLTVAGQTFRIGQNGAATHDYLARTNFISVEALASEKWRVTSDANWISVVNAGSGKGNGTVTIAIEENPSWKPRTGIVQIGTEMFTVTQNGQTALEFALNPPSTTASVEGENGLIAVTATPDLPWSAESTAHWLTISGTTGTGAGNGNVEYSAAPNPTLHDRIGTILVTPGDTKVDAQMHTVTQPAASSALSATGHDFAAEGGSCTLKVTVSDIVEWQIQNNIPWLTVVGATNRVGPATLTLKAAATDSLQPRSGTVAIAGKPFTVTQAAAGSLLTPTGYEFGEDGGSCEVWVSVPDIVNWQIRNTNNWLTVVGATNRVGPVPVTLQAVANETVDSKEGTVTIAGTSFAVSQKGRGVEVGYETKLFGADGGSDTLSIHPDGNASWTAVVSDPTWITVFGSNSGTGDGEVMYIVSSFVGDETARTGTITVGDKVVYITQRAFDLSISPKKATVAGESGTGSFKVTTGSGNAWQALVPDSWLSWVEGNGSGTGNGTVKYRYAANDTGTARKGKILVAGEVFTLQQQSRPLFPEAQDTAEIATFLDQAVDRRLGWRIRSMEEYDSFRAWLTEKGIDRQAVKDSPHAWISYALGAERLFGEEPTIQIDGFSVSRGGAKGAGNATVMDVCVVVHDGGSEVAVDAGKVAGLFEATGDLCDWDGDAKLSATATQTGGDVATMQFKVVPGDGQVDEAFLRLGLKEKDSRQRQTISFTPIGEKTWKDRVNLSALASSGGPVTFEVVSGPGKIEDGNVLSFTSSGLVKVQAMQTGNDIWLPATATQTVTVAKVEQTVSFAGIGAQFATNRVELSATATSGLAVTFAVVSELGKIDGNVLTFTGAGTLEVRAMQAGDERWLPASATQTVTVAKVEQTVSFAEIGAQFATNRVELSATATSGGEVTFKVMSGPGKIEGNVLTFTGPGTVEVRVVQAGDDRWLPVSETQTVAVAKAAQAISFTAIGLQLATNRVEMSATATSGGTVAFEVVSGPGKIEGSVLTFTGEGTVEVRAVQAGNDLWLSAMATQMVAVIDASKLYMVVDLSAGSGEGASYPVSYLTGVPEGGWTDEYKTTKLVLRLILPGTFIMGSTDATFNKPHQVTLTKPYYMGVFEVTQKQYELVTGNNPSYYRGDKRPVESVSWNTIRGDDGTYTWPDNSEVDANSFMGRIGARTGLKFDLPTEAQAEYACRAGTTSKYNNGGNSEDDMKQLGRCMENRHDGKGGYSQHTTVGSYLPNAWGLYDMHGNVLEWCLDGACLTIDADDVYADGITDPVGPSGYPYWRLARCGKWYMSAGKCTSTSTSEEHPWESSFGTCGACGFRLVRILSE